MEGFQQTATEQHSRVNGYCEARSPLDEADVRWTPPEVESAGSDSCGAASASESTDIREVKTRESEDEEDEAEKGEVLSARGPLGEQKNNQKEDENQDSCHSLQNNSASSSYTGKKLREILNKWRQKLNSFEIMFFFFLVWLKLQIFPICLRHHYQSSSDWVKKITQGLGSAWSVRSVGTRRLASIMEYMPVKAVR